MIWSLHMKFLFTHSRTFLGPSGMSYYAYENVLVATSANFFTIHKKIMLSIGYKLNMRHHYWLTAMIKETNMLLEH